MTTSPTPDEPTPPPAPVPPQRAPSGKWGVPPSTSPQLTPTGRSAKPPGVRAVLWAALLVLIGVIALLIVLSA
ncbi:hypothetical protein [Mycolicibacter heraklionensis]|uniref:hypothetical protein n=1 Tax=Mycolicibacter heraklionensis TaxID=512402 RepID=UPI001041E2C8|nr:MULTISPECIES: hypothetical protein [Mycobacteriaceae]